MPRQITKKEWAQYEWLKVQEVGNEPMFIRGVKHIPPPDDKFVYFDDTRIGDTETRWVPAMTEEAPKHEIVRLQLGDVPPRFSVGQKVSVAKFKGTVVQTDMSNGDIWVRLDEE